jgi:hypothetical protein
VRRRALRAFPDVLPPARPIERTVSSKPGNLFPTAAQAIRLGGRVAVGIGDTAAEMVRCVST